MRIQDRHLNAREKCADAPFTIRASPDDGGNRLSRRARNRTPASATTPKTNQVFDRPQIAKNAMTTRSINKKTTRLPPEDPTDGPVLEYPPLDASFDTGSPDLDPSRPGETRESTPVLIVAGGGCVLAVPNGFGERPCFGEKSDGSISTETPASSRRRTMAAMSSPPMVSIGNARRSSSVDTVPLCFAVSMNFPSSASSTDICTTPYGRWFGMLH